MYRLVIILTFALAGCFAARHKKNGLPKGVTCTVMEAEKIADKKITIAAGNLENLNKRMEMEPDSVYHVHFSSKTIVNDGAGDIWVSLRNCKIIKEEYGYFPGTLWVKYDFGKYWIYDFRCNYLHSIESAKRKIDEAEKKSALPINDVASLNKIIARAKATGVIPSMLGSGQKYVFSCAQVDTSYHKLLLINDDRIVDFSSNTYYRIIYEEDKKWLQGIIDKIYK